MSKCLCKTLFRALACLVALDICQSQYRNLECVAERYELCCLLTSLCRKNIVKLLALFALFVVYRCAVCNCADRHTV